MTLKQIGWLNIEKNVKNIYLGVSGHFNPLHIINTEREAKKREQLKRLTENLQKWARYRKLPNGEKPPSYSSPEGSPEKHEEPVDDILDPDLI